MAHRGFDDYLITYLYKWIPIRSIFNRCVAVIYCLAKMEYRSLDGFDALVQPDLDKYFPSRINLLCMLVNEWSGHEA